MEFLNLEKKYGGNDCDTCGFCGIPIPYKFDEVSNLCPQCQLINKIEARIINRPKVWGEMIRRRKRRTSSLVLANER